MRNRQVFIELRPTRLDVVVADHDGVVDARRIETELHEETSEWIRDVKRLGDKCGRIVQELGCTGMNARVLYQSPTQMIAIESLEARQAVQCCEAARLECFDSLKYSLLSATSDATVIGRDAHGQRRRTHALATVDRDDVVRAIADMVEGAGLRFQSATPTDAAINLLVGKWALKAEHTLADQRGERDRHASDSISPRPVAILYIGEHSSCLMIADRGNLLFSRRLQIGLDAFVNALTNPIRSEGRDEPINLSRAQAVHILHTYGVPRNDAVISVNATVDPEDGADPAGHADGSDAHHRSPVRQITGQQLTPLMQPLLQRFTVELRQSLRFGATGDNETSIAIQCRGPGGLLDGLAELIEQELNVPVHGQCDVADPGDEQTNHRARRSDCPTLQDASAPGGTGSVLADVLQESHVLDRLNLLPRDVARSRRLKRLQRWLWTGAAAAVVLIAFDATRFSMQLDAHQEQADRIVSQQHDIKALGQTQQRLMNALNRMREMEQRITQEIHATAPADGILREVARITPDSIRLTRITLSRSEDGLVGTLSGIAMEQAITASGDQEIKGSDVGSAESHALDPSFVSTAESDTERKPVRSLSAFISQLRTSPLFADASLGNVHAGSAEGIEGTRFEATVTVTDVPVAPRLAGIERQRESSHE